MNTNPSYGRIIWDLLRSVMTNTQAAAVQAFLKSCGYDVTRNKSYPIGTLLEALKKLCPKDNLFQTIKTIFIKKDYYSNKPTYVGVLETISFERSLGKEMFSISNTKHKTISN